MGAWCNGRSHQKTIFSTHLRVITSSSHRRLPLMSTYRSAFTTLWVGNLPRRRAGIAIDLAFLKSFTTVVTVDYIRIVEIWLSVYLPNLGKLHKGVRCFLRKVKLGGLRWGGDNPNLCAPTQFDDARFESDPSIGNSLLQQINQECEYFGYIDL